MAGHVMNKARFLPHALLSLAALLPLAACNSPRNDAASQGSLAGAAIGGPFTLTDQDGKRVSWDDYRGRYRILYFGYTYCPDVCPLDLQKLMAGFRLFEKRDPARAAKVQPIFISVDPKRDTPPVLKNYVAAFHPRLIGLTGSAAQIADVTKEFAVVYGKEGDGKSTDYLVSHSRTPYLFGPDGKPVALMPVDDPATPGKDEGAPQEVLRELDYWVK